MHLKLIGETLYIFLKLFGKNCTWTYMNYPFLSNFKHFPFLSLALSIVHWHILGDVIVWLLYNSLLWTTIWHGKWQDITLVHFIEYLEWNSVTWYSDKGCHCLATTSSFCKTNISNSSNILHILFCIYIYILNEC